MILHEELAEVWLVNKFHSYDPADEYALPKHVISAGLTPRPPVGPGDPGGLTPGPRSPKGRLDALHLESVSGGKSEA
jgi:hypothetical protein